MDETAASLATYLLERLQSLPSERRLLVGVCGIPASGKTTLTLNIVKKLNLSEDGIAVCVGLDGWHFSREELNKFENVKEAYDRRGAAFTFDAASYVHFVTKLRQSPYSNVTPPPQTSFLYAPTFDHALKDPVPNGLTILPSHRIVLIEGLYAFTNTPEWRPASETLDERWLVEVDISEATRRLVQRHVTTGVTGDLDEAKWRAENNDTPSKPCIAPTGDVKRSFRWLMATK
ncbi:P-loop nucleoside triphosphate hydrolase [Ceratobasidium theobromae]|uniref:P-loop nucleoside triphosphate hydrolase n=1 Tax=Ceratobasidium theobromae TaxID=1582974 RepID=A0A5N5QIA4_9AGAM|nr:P-loop nucleoside triphosphate hydrolase [Ceratobasidium theobromae]